MPIQGNAMSQEAEDVFVTELQTAATADGPGTVADIGGLAGPATLEIVNSGSGASTLNLECSFDGAIWYACGYMQIDGVANPVRSVTGIAVPATSQHVYGVLDAYARLRGRLSGTAAGASVTATLRALPV